MFSLIFSTVPPSWGYTMTCCGHHNFFSTLFSTKCRNAQLYRFVNLVKICLQFYLKLFNFCFFMINGRLSYRFHENLFFAMIIAYGEVFLLSVIVIVCEVLTSPGIHAILSKSPIMWLVLWTYTDREAFFRLPWHHNYIKYRTLVHVAPDL